MVELDPLLTREAWLHHLTSLLRAHFALNGYALPPILHLSVGWPSTRAKSTTNRRLGECWPSDVSADGAPHVFISPILDDPHDVAATLVHELLHATGISGHKREFKAGMKKLGLAGKATATHAGPELTALLKALVADMPPYPHPALVPGESVRKQKSRQLKLVCPEHTDYIVRASKQLINRTPPLCGECHSPMQMETE